MFPRRRGFSLPEAVLVLVILGFLGAIIWGRLQNSRAVGTVETLRASLAEIRLAEESFWNENKRYSADPIELRWKATNQVSVRLTSTDPAVGYDAVAAHPELPGVSCTVAVRRTVTGPDGAISCK